MEAYDGVKISFLYTSLVYHPSNTNPSKHYYKLNHSTIYMQTCQLNHNTRAFVSALLSCRVVLIQTTVAILDYCRRRQSGQHT
jgi:hypothetical protein